eukprot:3363928-Pyramimonas_sp.AAC.2
MSQSNANSAGIFSRRTNQTHTPGVAGELHDVLRAQGGHALHLPHHICAVYTQRENQSLEGRQYIPIVRTYCTRGGSIDPA